MCTNDNKTVSNFISFLYEINLYNLLQTLECKERFQAGGTSYFLNYSNFQVVITFMFSSLFIIYLPMYCVKWWFQNSFIIILK